MEKDLDIKLYNEYLDGEKSAFELLYNKYKDKIQYFVYNIVKDYQKAEDITQDVFIYVMQNKIKEGYTFKYYLYLVAKSRAYNLINMEKRRIEINEDYYNGTEQVGQDVADIVTKNEKRKAIMSAIDMLDDRYKNAIYLVKIEELTYQETAQILGESVQNIKNLIHRGKKELRKILIKKGFDEMSKVSKVIIAILCISVVLAGGVYAITVIYNNYIKNNTNHHVIMKPFLLVRSHNITMNPTYQSTLDENTINNLWVGTLDLAWKDLKEKIGVDKIELEGDNPKIVDELNNSTFSKEMLNEKDYQINVERTVTDGYKIDATLNKELNFLEVFDNFSNDYTKWKFGKDEDFIKYFGINNASSEEMNKNVEILFYNKIGNGDLRSNDMAIKLKTKEDDEIILYRTNDKKTFDEYYKDIELKSKQYNGRTKFSEDDELRIPYIRINGMISYNELYGKEIKNSKELYIYDVIQNINFSLNEKGCNLSSKATMVTEYMGIGEDTKYCYFDDTFIIFMKEKNSDRPYFALKVDNSDILEKIEETDEPKVTDYTMMENKDRYRVLDGEYKFFEDDKYEYYYPTQKTKLVNVWFKNGEHMTAEDALKQGKIKIELLDKYEVEYIKKEK